MCLVAEKREGNFEIRHFVRQPNPSLVFFFVFFLSDYFQRGFGGSF